MPTIKGAEKSFFKSFKFRVEIDGFADSRFQKCSAIEAEVAVIEQSEGGDLVADKSPGRVKFADVTLTRGATKNQDMANWFEQVVDAAANSGLADAEYKRTVDIVQLDRNNQPIERTRLFKAWPSKLKKGEWSDADENLMAELTLTYEYAKTIPLS